MGGEKRKGSRERIGGRKQERRKREKDREEAVADTREGRGAPIDLTNFCINVKSNPECTKTHHFQVKTFFF